MTEVKSDAHSHPSCPEKPCTAAEGPRCRGSRAKDLGKNVIFLPASLFYSFNILLHSNQKEQITRQTVE